MSFSNSHCSRKSRSSNWYDSLLFISSSFPKITISSYRYSASSWSFTFCSAGPNPNHPSDSVVCHCWIALGTLKNWSSWSFFRKKSIVLVNRANLPRVRIFEMTCVESTLWSRLDMPSFFIALSLILSNTLRTSFISGSLAANRRRNSTSERRDR